MLAAGESAALFLNDTQYTHTHLTAVCPDYPGEPVPER